MRDFDFILALGLMAAMAFLTRIGGAIVLSRVESSPGLERFLSGMSTSVIAAMVATLLARGGADDLLAVIVACAVMLASRNMIAAMIGGMVSAIACVQMSGLP